MKITYSTQRSGFAPGVAYANPRYYHRPMEGVTEAVVMGDFPKIVADYEAAGARVTVLPATPRYASVAPAVVPARIATPSPDAPAAAPPPELAEKIKARDGEDIVSLRARYAEAVGKKPFNGWDAATLKAKMAAAQT